MGMKNILVSITTSTTLLFLLLLAQTRATEELVLDSDGNPVEAGSEYFLRPIGNSRGYISSASVDGPFSCPLYAIEVPYNTLDPITTVRLLPTDLETRHINVSSPLQINSGFSFFCRDDGIWKLKFSAWSRTFLVVVSGVAAPKASFTIETSETGYQFASDDRVLGFTNTIGSTTKVLGLTTSEDANNILNVQFIKKTDDDINTVVATN